MAKKDITSLIELEKMAKELVSELDKIKKVSAVYEDAKTSLIELSTQLIGFQTLLKNLIESIQNNSRTMNKNLTSSNTLLTKQIESNENHMKKINSSFGRLEKELKKELDVTKNLIYKDNVEQFSKIENNLSDKFKSFQLRGLSGLVFLVIMILILVKCN